MRELPDNSVGRALDATGDALASAGGKVVDVSKDVGSTVADKTGDAAHAVGDKAGDVKDATVQGAKTAGRATANAADEAGEKTASGAKKAAKATAKGAKKVGGAIKRAVTPQTETKVYLKKGGPSAALRFYQSSRAGCGRVYTPSRAAVEGSEAGSHP